jgi:hypothetical protein
VTALWTPASSSDLYARNGFSVLCISDHNEYGDQDGGILPAYQTDSLLHDWNGDGQLFAEHVFGSGVEAYVRDYAKAQETWKRDPWYRSDVVEAPVLISGAEMTRAGWHIGVLGLPPGPLAPPDGDQGYMQQARAAGGLVFLGPSGRVERFARPPRIEARSVAVRGHRNHERLAPRSSEAARRRARGRHAARRPGLPGGESGAGRDAALGRLAVAGPSFVGLRERRRAHVGRRTRRVSFHGVRHDSDAGAQHRGFPRGAARRRVLRQHGLYFRALGAHSDSVLAWAPQADRIRFIGWGGRVLLDSDAPRVAYRVQGDEGYVRVEATAAPRDKAWPRQAWSQPFFIEPVTCSPAAAGRNSQ